MGTFFLVFILPQLIAWLLAWKELLTPVVVIIFIIGVVFWKITGYRDILMLSLMMAFIGLAYEFAINAK